MGFLFTKPRCLATMIVHCEPIIPPFAWFRFQGWCQFHLPVITSKDSVGFTTRVSRGQRDVEISLDTHKISFLKNSSHKTPKKPTFDPFCMTLHKGQITSGSFVLSASAKNDLPLGVFWEIFFLTENCLLHFLAKRCILVAVFFCIGPKSLNKILSKGPSNRDKLPTITMMKGLSSQTSNPCVLKNEMKK